MEPENWLLCSQATAVFISPLFYSCGSTAPSGSGPPVVEASQSYSDTPHSVGLLWSYRRDFYLSIHKTRNRHPCPRRDSNPQFQQASNHWHRLSHSLGKWDQFTSFHLLLVDPSYYYPLTYPQNLPSDPLSSDFVTMTLYILQCKLKSESECISCRGWFRIP